MGEMRPVPSATGGGSRELYNKRRVTADAGFARGAGSVVSRNTREQPNNIAVSCNIEALAHRLRTPPYGAFLSFVLERLDDASFRRERLRPVRDENHIKTPGGVT
jgi:hypothetical protein